jgi:uncharacterized membrane protein
LDSGAYAAHHGPVIAAAALSFLHAAFERPADVFAFALWLFVFPIYHTLYPRLARRLPGRTALEPVDLLRRSWIERLLETRSPDAAAQQMRNLTTINTTLATSALILLGFAANMINNRGTAGPHDPTLARLVLIVAVLAVAFSYFVNSLRHIGLFTLTIGADPKLVEQLHGSATDYFGALVARASLRYTQGLRTFFGAFPLFLWLFHGWLFLGATAAASAWFLLRDFRRPRSPLPSPEKRETGASR